jgi:hypothetical protein
MSLGGRTFGEAQLPIGNCLEYLTQVISIDLETQWGCDKFFENPLGFFPCPQPLSALGC